MTEGRSTGELPAQSAVRSVDLGDVRLTYVTDGAMAMRPSGFFPHVPASYWDGHPEALDSRGRVIMSAGGLLVERDGEALLIDTGYGDYQGESRAGRVNTGALPEVLAALGYPPERIGAVAFTHLHIDHTGWAFRPDGNGSAEKMFPKASYIVAAEEWAPHQRGENQAGTPPRVAERLAACDLTLVEDGTEIIPGVTALVTPGHTPGHTCYVISGAGRDRVIALGDAFHMPAQIAHPEWPSLPDFDTHGVLAVRERLRAELEQPGTRGFACHFGDQVFGRVTRDPGGAPVWEPVPTTELGPPPRHLD
ncbi:MAG: MBL fold metallo-hydrolase [Streptosporangiales bacterium]|nr:MBL fold metallo-hydrolase [Streptosporangiales bacterium]